MTSRARNLLLATTALVPLGATLAATWAGANPLGAQVVGGNATVQGQGTAAVTVTQSTPKAIINWNTFNIAPNETTKFVQPDANAIALNKVVGNLGPSMIDGLLTANGKIFIVNGDGILFGPHAVVNVGSLLATTSDIKNADFMAGRYNFSIPGRPDASIVNLGNITAANGGFAALVAPGVRNSGTITATLGTVALAAGNVFNLDFYGDKLINLAVNDQIAATVKDVATGKPLDALVKNDGALRANGGRVELTAAAVRVVVDSVINTSGVIEANSIGVKNGVITLSAATGASKPAGAPTQVVKVSGNLSAAGQKAGTKSGGSYSSANSASTDGETGGKIVVTGEKIVVAGAKIDASGPSGGGTVLIGGDWSGGKPQAGLVNNPSAKLEAQAIPNATTVTVDAASTIDVSATVQGNGGKAIVWSDGTTTFNGTILANGGPQGGDGGFVEVSGHALLNFNGTVNTLAPLGKNGTLLLDPQDYYISDTPPPNPNASSITTGTLVNQLSGGNVVIATDNSNNPNFLGQNGDIFVNNSFTWTTNNSLTLNAFHDITISAGVVIKNTSNTPTGGADLILHADSTGTGQGTVKFSSALTGPPNTGKIDYTASTGNVSIYYNPQPTTFKYTNPTDYSPNVMTNPGVPNQLTAFMLVNSAADLQLIGTNSGFLGGTLSNNYALGKSFIAGNFTPIGSVSSPFTGKFDGLGNTITGLTIAPTGVGDQSIGMFAAIGSGGVVSNLTLADVSVTANPNFTGPGQFVGTLAGQNWGTISNVSVTGNSTINGLQLVGVIAGGLVGQNGVLGPNTAPGKISGSSANVNVTLGDGCFNNCPNGGFNAAGGLVGSNVANSTIKDSSASGAIVIGANGSAGGLVGQNGVFIPNGNIQTTSPGSITNSSATGAVSSAGTNVMLGGLAGMNSPGSTITDSLATGNVTASANLAPSQTGSNCAANNNCQFIAAGGLVGQNSGTIQGTGILSQTPSPCVIGIVCATGNVFVGSLGTAGGLVGLNDGIIVNAIAIGNVTGAAGVAGNKTNSDNQTTLGGLVGNNQGQITNAFALGDVGSANVPFLQVGGLVGDNSGTIQTAFALGQVKAGDNSVAGGLTANNSPNDNNCGGCFHGDGFNNNAQIANVGAAGDVTVGAASLAGGLTGGNEGSISNAVAIGAVTAGGNSVIGGLAGAVNVGGSISNSIATGAVTSTGANSIAGGFVGINGGAIDPSVAGGPVSGTSNSLLGGFVGVNMGTITQASTLPTSTVTGSGANNIVGGLVALNLGGISQSQAAGDVSSGDNSIVGGLVGANASFVNFAPGTIPGSSFPTGTISNSTASGNASGGANSTVGGLIGANGGTFTNSSATGTATAGPNSHTDPQVASNSNPTQNPSNPAIVQGCDAAICNYYETGVFTGGGQPQPQPQPGPSAPPPPAVLIPPTTQVTQLVTSQDPGTQTTSGPVFTQTTAGGPSGPSGGPPKGNQPGTKPGPSGYTIPAIGDKNFTGVPPLGETRFLFNEGVAQVAADFDQGALEAILRQFRLTLLEQQTLGLTGRRLLRFRTEGSVVEAIRAMEKAKVPLITTPQYTFVMAQDASAADASREGDPSQYVVEKLRLSAAHRLSKGDGVLIAVIDSQVDERHPELDGGIAERFDSAGTPVPPHPHGTGMAGAIASHSRLMGIAPNAKLLTIRAFGAGGAGAQGTTAQILAGLDWAVSKGARIVNMSFAGPQDPMLREAIKKIRDKGILMVAAAGNAGPKSPPLYPGADANVIAVTATDTDDRLFSGANRGRYVAVAAPGVDVLVPAPDGDYQFTTGTSVAAAHVSGVAALLMARKPDASAETIRAVLLSSAKDLGPKGRDDQFGWGLVDPYQALLALDAGAAPVR